jgi:hypothetical protein
VSEVVPESTGADRINEAVVAFLGCVSEPLADICSIGWTIGETYVPFDPDPDDPECEAEEVYCSQAWVRVTEINPISQESFDDDCATVMRIGLEVGVLRCVEIPAEGEAPKASDVLLAAMQSMADMNAIYCAAMACDVWDSIDAGAWVPNGPQGGQYGGTWSFTVEI